MSRHEERPPKLLDKYLLSILFATFLLGNDTTFGYFKGPRRCLDRARQLLSIISLLYEPFKGIIASDREGGHYAEAQLCELQVD
jgi:hypothetical protein